MMPEYEVPSAAEAAQLGYVDGGTKAPPLQRRQTLGKLKGTGFSPYMNLAFNGALALRECFPMRIKSLPAIMLWLSASCALCQSWTIGNDRIERVVSFDPISGVVTQRLTDLKTHTEYIPPQEPTRRAALEFSFACNGETLTGATFQLQKADQSSLPDGKSLTIHLQSKTFPLEVAVVYRVYDGHPAIRKWLLLRNTGVDPVASLPHEYRSHRTLGRPLQ